MKEILAKKDSNSKESLFSHTENVLKVWELLFKQLKDVFSDNTFWELSYISILLHDFGKVTLNFQDKISGRVDNFDNYIRHELYSGIFILLNNKSKFISTPLPLLSVFSHHKPLNENIFDNENDSVIVHVDLDSYHRVVNYYQQKLFIREVNFEFQENVIDRLSQKLPLSIFIDTYKNYLKNVSIYFDDSSRKRYIYYKAILNTCDWLGSAHEVPQKGIIFSEPELKNRIILKLLSEGKSKIANKFQFRKFQLKAITSRNAIIIAPTGSGKTEAALLWASQKKANERIVYLLPTRVTSNSIYERLKQYFGDTNVAIVHSSALFYRKETNENYNQKYYLKDKTFFQNINVCTIDQVLTQGFNLGYWELKTFHMLNAWIVIDEIHLYAPYTLGLIISTISYLKSEFGARFFIMSATMPSKLKELLEETLGKNNFQFIQDTELLAKSRNVFEIRDCMIDDIFDEIKSQIKLEKKVLVVVNTVNEAIRIYKELKEYASKAICYHSRFMQKDRLDKEQEILLAEKSDSSLLLIATQVIEVSLDIDFDILFTENAPIDAIVQRAGRVNRRRTKKETKVIIFRETEITRKWVYDIPDILETSFSILRDNHSKSLTEKQLLNIVNRVYRDIEIKSNEHFIDGINKYNEIQTNLHFIKDNLNKEQAYTREGLDTISVIPMINIKNNIGEKEIYYQREFFKKDTYFKAKHELLIRKSKQYTFSIERDNFGFNYIDAKYYYETGLNFNLANNNSTIFI